MTQIIPFADLPYADLIVDAIYEGGSADNTGDDSISKLLGCGNQGGFRKVGSPARLVVLYSSLEDPDWPDGLDSATGLFVYYLEQEILAAVYRYFQRHPTAFEPCAAALAQMMDPNIIIDEVTRAAVDGGRDAIGRYRIGPHSDPVEMEFALEAKCYGPGILGLPSVAVGVKETSRLISRLRHRQFGILVTTSFVHKQAYAEIRQDRHPVIILCGRDIAQILIDKGKNSAAAVTEWLTREFPLPEAVFVEPAAAPIEEAAIDGEAEGDLGDVDREADTAGETGLHTTILGDAADL